MDRRDFIRLGMSAILAAQFPINTFAAREENENGLMVRFLGTGAADWNGRDERGELRRLSSVLLDRRILIDYTDSVAEMIPEGCIPEAVFYTHSHGDHYKPAALLGLGVNKVYVSDSWLERALADFRKAANESGRDCPEIIPLSIGETIKSGKISITALPGNHETADVKEQTLIYLIEKEDVRLLYATDTGGIPAKAARIAQIDRHRTIKPVTALIMEATMGMGHDEDFRIFTHSSVGTVLSTANVLMKTGAYTPGKGQPVYLTHMARTLHGTQKELDASLPSPLKAAFDGLEVVFHSPEHN